MESGTTGPDPHQEVPREYQASADDPSPRRRPADDNPEPSQPESGPANQSGSEPRTLWLGPSIEIGEAGVLIILAWRGAATAEGIANVSGLDVPHTRLLLRHLESAGLAIGKKASSPGSVEPITIYQASDDGLRWLQDREIGRFVGPEY